ncbi:unnamed protein product [Penicillium camemberti]|uniref:Str. FM013 n=1 Tax=Penicillium camemberti (strain FM 013) TaxID=1429867 RepID=A0A0G4PWG3_PENC3|nr:unnamed protein product [Penicillium camemberti]
MHCPEATQPIVTFLGVVIGQLKGGPTLLCRLQTTRWANFPPLSIITHVFLTGRIFGLTKEHRQLAVVTDDIHFLPTPNNHLPATPSSTGKRKRVDRWSQRAGSQTPTKSATGSQ